MKKFIDISSAAAFSSRVIPESSSRKSVVTKRRDSVTLRAAQPYGMTSVWGGRTMGAGFTLIELLVVVLIIGILSAVALPQYTRAVEKSRVAEAKTVLKEIAQAQDAYMLASPDGRPTDDFSQLDITVPNSGKWSYWLDEDMGPGTYALCAEQPGKNYYILYMKGYGPEDGEFYCSPTDPANKGCEIFGGTLFEQASTGWDLVKL